MESATTIGVGSVYKNTNESMMLLVVALYSLSARCVVVWINEDVTTAYRVGEMDNWNLELIEEHWTRLD